MCCILIEQKILQTRPSIRTPAMGVMKYTILVNLGHHYYILSLSDLFLGVKKRGRNITFTPYDYAPAQKPLVIITVLQFSDVCLGVEKNILQEIMHFHCMTCIATPQHKNPCPRGHEI